MLSPAPPALLLATVDPLFTTVPEAPPFVEPPEPPFATQFTEPPTKDDALPEAHEVEPPAPTVTVKDEVPATVTDP
jgi:hypothetical protein